MSQGFNHYLEEIIQVILQNDNLTNLLSYDTQDALTRPNLTDIEKSQLPYKKIFPFRFIPNISDSASSYLNIGFGNFKEISNVFQAGRIGFYMVCHKDLWRMDGGLRPIFMLEEIKNVAKNLEGLGLGRLKLVGCDEYAYNNSFIGFYAVYEIVDFNSFSG